MISKKARNHSCGQSNIDYRSLKDTENIKKFQPWKLRKDFGTMGCSDYHLNLKEYKELMLPTSKLNNLHDKKNEIPNPKFYDTAVFYANQKIKVKREIPFFDKAGELDESIKGKDKFTGDSMMIAQITKTRKKFSQVIDNTEKSKKAKKVEQLVVDKKERNRDVIAETQLVKIDNTSNTAEHKIDINKINEIRKTLRRRYANRTDFRKIFKQWDKTGSGVINLRNAKDMINDFGIPINFNETKALILSSSKKGEENLDLAGFMNLIFNDNEALKIDNKNFKYKDESLYEGDKMEEFNKDLQQNLGVSSKKIEQEALHNYLRIRIPVLVKAFNNNNKIENKDTCNYQEFSKIVKSLNIHQNYTHDSLLTHLYNKFRNRNNEMEFHTFIEDLRNTTYENNFFDLEDKVHTKLKDKIEEHKRAQLDHFELLNEKPYLLKYTEVDHNLTGNNKNTKAIESENRNMEKINTLQPSQAFFNNTFKDGIYYNNKLKERIDFISPKIDMGDQRKTRYGANPEYPDTKSNFQSRPNTGMYITEKDRFDIRGKNEIDYQVQDKLKRQQTAKVRAEKINISEKNISDKKFMNELFREERNVNNLLQSAQKIFNYESVCRNRNFFIE